MAKLLNYPHANELIEAFQTNAMRFAFVSKVADNTFQQLHASAQCREYFNEILMCNFHEDFKFVPTYGMNYIVKDFPIDTEETCLVVIFESDSSKNTFMENLEFINQMENKVNVEPTKVLEVDGSSMKLILIGDKFWMKKCILFNIYTLFIKLASLNAGKKSYSALMKKFKYETPSELQYISSVGGVEQFTKIVQNVQELAAIPTKYIDGSDELRKPYEVHGKSGIVFFMHIVQNQMKTMTYSIKQMCMEFKRISESQEPIGKLFGVLK